MKISDILKEDKVTLTYEVFPPRRSLRTAATRKTSGSGPGRQSAA